MLMDPINIFVGINIIAIFGASFGAAKKGLKSSVSAVKEKPKGFLQAHPPLIATVLLIAGIISIFQVGVFEYSDKYRLLRLIGLGVYIISSWLQIKLYNTLGDNYSQEVVIFKHHQLVQKGLYRYIRHPYYLFQILSDLGFAAALLSYIVLPIAVIEIPILIMRASLEDNLLNKHFPAQFSEYKRKSGFMLPFIG